MARAPDVSPAGSNERTDQAVEASLDEFRRSWRRPKWHIIAAAPSARVH